MRILFTGGGTMGSVSPLLAQIDYLLSEHGFLPTDFLWVGTKTGPEGKIISKYNIEFKTITNGKLRRYFSFKNFIDPLKVGNGYLQSLEYIHKFKPNLVVTAGSFVSVPVVLAAKTLGVPVLVHQLDLKPGLANRIMSRFAKIVTVSWPDLLNKFPKVKTKWVGVPIRRQIMNPITNTLAPKLNLIDNLPLLLVIGGGTGAITINKLVVDSLEILLPKYQIVHITGDGKKIKTKIPRDLRKRYFQKEFIDEDLGYLLKRADLIISRAGIGTISEILTKRKPAIIIPIPDSHQEDNANYFANLGCIKVLSQDGLSGKLLAKEINSLIEDKDKQKEIMKNSALLIKNNANELLSKEILNFK